MLLIPLRPSYFLGSHFWTGGWGLGARASGFLPPTKDANEKSQDAKRFKRRSKVKESEHVLDVVVLLLRLLLGVGMILLSLLRLLLFLLVGAAVTVLEKIERKANDKDIGASFSSTSSSSSSSSFSPSPSSWCDSDCFRSLSKLGCIITPLFEAFRSWVA